MQSHFSSNEWGNVECDKNSCHESNVGKNILALVKLK